MVSVLFPPPPRETEGVLVRLMGIVRGETVAVWVRVGVATLEERERSEVDASNDGVDVRLLGD